MGVGAHIKAMELDEANGMRFLLSSERTYSWLELATILKQQDGFGDRFAFPVVAKESAQAAVDIALSARRAKEVLGISLTPVTTTLVDMANAMMARRMIE